MDPHVIWDLEDEPDGNVRHCLEHDVTVEEVEEVLLHSKDPDARSRSSDRRITFGYTTEGRYLAVVWEHVLDAPLTIRPVTAYEVPEPSKRKRKRK